MTDDAYQRLLAHAREVALLESTAALLAWDQETMMPPRGVEHRARQLAQMARLGHEWATRPEVGAWLDACEPEYAIAGDAGGPAAANVRELRRSYDRATKLPPALVAELAETTSLAQHEWAGARAASDFARFRPWLEKLVTLQRSKAECLGFAPGGEAWDALLDGFEPGATAAELQELFDGLRPRLVALVGDVVGREPRTSGAFRGQRLPVADQERFVRFVAERLGFDFARGRLDRSTHPFSIGIHCTDVRLTTRFGDDDVVDALGSTMHEAGHGMYEQGLPAEHAGTPLGSAASLGIHESQSRLWENQVGRGRPFWTWCHPQLRAFFGGAVARYGVDEMFAAANAVEASLIRVEADEATYNLHIMVRFDIERAMLRGDLAPADVPGEWNRAMREYLGIDVPDDRRGCLQDVHWSSGLFGYFPTYTLGSLYAAQLFDAARADLADLDGQIAAGEFAALRGWLNEHVHAYGQRFQARELCEAVCGRPLSAEPFLTYLEAKLRDVYRMS